MSSAPSPSIFGLSLHSGSSLDSRSSHSDSLARRGKRTKEHEDSFLYPKAITSRPEDALLPLAGILSQPEASVMSGSDRSGGRDVHIFSTSDQDAVIGGLHSNGITNANFCTMIEILLFFDGEYVLRDENNIVVAKDNSLLQPGKYYIDSPYPFIVNNETPLVRTISSSNTGPRTNAFRNAVRERDGRCVITGEVALGALYGNWRGFEAAHLFPLAYEEHWKNENFARWITISPIAGGTINSVQNGMLLDSSIHQQFDAFDFAINPDDSYKIVHFGYDTKRIAGKHLDSKFLDDPQRPPDELFRWHFRQAVLINMRGAGEPSFEHDFPAGSDMMGSILDGPEAAKRMEFELFNRLALEFDLTE